MPLVLTANLQYAYDNAGPDVIVVNNLLDTLYDTSEVIRVTKKERFFNQVPYWERPDFFKYESQSVVGRIPANSMNSNSLDGSLVQDVNAKESLAIEEPVINVPLINAVAPGVSIHLFSGALAGMVGAVMLQPFDLLKTRLQQQHTSSNMIVTTTIAKELRKLTQVKDLWRGTLPSMVRTSIGAGLYFSILSNTRTRIATYKKKQTPDINITSSTSVLPKLSHFENLATGFVVRALVGLFTMPITIVKTRFESSMYNYKSIYEGVQGIYLDTGNAQKQKSLRNFFKGSVATLARDCPYAGLYVLFYEGFKNDVMPALNLVLPSDFQELNAGIINSSSAVLAASVSTTLTAPFDAIKTRLQLTNQSSIAKTTRALLSEQGGVRNLFRGLSLRLGRKGLSSGISWCIYEELIKSDLKSWSGKKRLA